MPEFSSILKDPKFLWTIVILVGFAILLSILERLKDRWYVSFRRYQYRRKDFLMTKAEHQFFDILTEVLGEKYYVFPQIHLSTIIDHKIKGQNWIGAFMHINQKSVDYVICDKSYIKPLIAIELDDKSHERADREERDEEVERILGGAGLPLLRVPHATYYDKTELLRE